LPSAPFAGSRPLFMLQCGTKPAVQPAPSPSIVIADSGFCKLLSIALTGKKIQQTDSPVGGYTFCRVGSPRKGEGFMELTQRHHEYWRKNLVVTAILLFVWFVVTFVEAWYARELNSITFFGFPFGFYMSAQGSLAIYVIIIGIYAVYMKKLDKEYNVDEGDLQ
jgi:putative solute:sodium symporter small subunit